MNRLFFLAIFSLTTSIGCAIHDVRSDHDKIRTTVIDLNTNQIMDNLIRASNGLPIIQIDYTNANANVTVEETANLSIAPATTNSSVLTIAAKSLLVSRQLVSTLIGGLGANHTNNIAITATPVLTSNEIYDAYLAFLGLPGSLQVSEAPPPCGAAHISRQYQKQYYWIPVEYKEAFYDLSLITTAQRDRLLEIPTSFAVSITDVDWKSLGPITGQPPNNTYIDVTIDKQIPNGDGTLDVGGQTPKVMSFVQHQTYNTDMYVRINDKKIYYAVDDKGNTTCVTLCINKAGRTIANKQDRSVAFNRRDPFVTNEDTKYFATNRLRLVANNELIALLKTTELPQPVSVNINHQTPPAPTTSELLDRIPFRTPQIKAAPLRSDSASADDGAASSGQKSGKTSVAGKSGAAQKQSPLAQPAAVAHTVVSQPSISFGPVRETDEGK